MAMSISNIPNFIRARSPRRLRVLMFQNNVRKSRSFTYDIQFDQGFWWAWYFEEADIKAP